jgi:hypothetical protein
MYTTGFRCCNPPAKVSIPVVLRYVLPVILFHILCFFLSQMSTASKSLRRCRGLWIRLSQIDTSVDQTFAVPRRQRKGRYLGKE